MKLNFSELLIRDLPYIIVIILCLGGMMWDLNHQRDIITSCNTHWQKQLVMINRSPDAYGYRLKYPTQPPENFNLSDSLVSEVG